MGYRPAFWVIYRPPLFRAAEEPLYGVPPFDVQFYLCAHMLAEIL